MQWQLCVCVCMCGAAGLCWVCGQSGWVVAPDRPQPGGSVFVKSRPVGSAVAAICGGQKDMLVVRAAAGVW